MSIVSINKERSIQSLSDRLTPEEIKGERCKRSYFYFIQEFWDEIVNDPPKWNWHIPYLCGEITQLLKDVAERKDKRYDLIVNVPPGTTKTLICTVFLPAWAWARGWWWMKFIKASYSDALSIEHAELTRLIVQSEKYQSLFPDIRIRPGSQAKSYYKIISQDPESNVWRMGGGLMSTSVGAKVTGFHAHVRLTDDPLDPFSSYSETMLESTNKWLDQNYSSRVVEKKQTPHILIQQRVHRKDPSGQELLKKKKGKKIKHICLPAEIQTQGNRERVSPQFLLNFYDKQDGYLDPVRLDQEAINDMELNLGTYGKKAQIDQNPSPPGSGMFNPERIKIVSLKDAKRMGVLATVRAWDNAGTEDGGAFTVGLKLAKAKDSRFIIMDIVRGQWASERRETLKEETTKLDGSTVTIIQEQEPGSSGKDQVKATKKALQKYGNRFIADRPTGDKTFRADPVSVAVNRGNVYMVEAPWNQVLKDEAGDFPNSDFKDQIDTLSAAYNHYMNVKTAGAWGR